MFRIYSVIAVVLFLGLAHDATADVVDDLPTLNDLVTSTDGSYSDGFDGTLRTESNSERIALMQWEIPPLGQTMAGSGKLSVRPNFILDLGDERDFGNFSLFEVSAGTIDEANPPPDTSTVTIGATAIFEGSLNLLDEDPDDENYLDIPLPVSTVQGLIDGTVVGLGLQEGPGAANFSLRSRNHGGGTAGNAPRLSFTTVPEPVSLGMLLLAALPLVGCRRRQFSICRPIRRR